MIGNGISALNEDAFLRWTRGRGWGGGAQRTCFDAERDMQL
jgi:hypothetical protein